jgi:hypothetical protein
MGYDRSAGGSGGDINDVGAALCLWKNRVLDNFSQYNLNFKNDTVLNRQNTIVTAFWAMRS